MVKEGDYFGERSFFTNLKRENTTISDKFSSLFMITQEDFIATIKDNKYDYVKISFVSEYFWFINKGKLHDDQRKTAIL